MRTDTDIDIRVRAAVIVLTSMDPRLSKVQAAFSSPESRQRSQRLSLPRSLPMHLAFFLRQGAHASEDRFNFGRRSLLNPLAGQQGNLDSISCMIR